MIWKKDGRDYTCTNTLTPGTIELAFHGDNDLQKLRVRRFGYSGVDLDVKSTDKEASATLGKTYSSAFPIAGNDTPDQKQLIEALKNEFEKTLLNDPEAFLCAPFDLHSIHLDNDKETGAVELNVALRLDRSFGGSAFRLASHSADTPERHQRMGRVALENGLAEVLGRFHRLASKFPEVKTIVVLGTYSTTEAVLDTQQTSFVTHHLAGGQVLGTDSNYHYGVIVQQGQGTSKNTVVKDEEARRTITFVMPAAQIPDTLDKKAISDAVLAGGKIVIEGVGGKE